MGFQLQSSAEFLYGLTFTMIFGLSFAAVWALYRLGDLPGRIARSREHPKAAAIGVCGGAPQAPERLERVGGALVNGRAVACHAAPRPHGLPPTTLAGTLHLLGSSLR